MTRPQKNTLGINSLMNLHGRDNISHMSQLNAGGIKHVLYDYIRKGLGNLHLAYTHSYKLVLKYIALIYIMGFSPDEKEKASKSAREELWKYASPTVFIFNKNPIFQICTEYFHRHQLRLDNHRTWHICGQWKMLENEYPLLFPAFSKYVLQQGSQAQTLALNIFTAC